MKLDDFLIQLFHEGKCLEAYRLFGAHLCKEENQEGVRFSVYAPNAKSVAVIGSFSNWESIPMEPYYDGGIYTVFIPNVKQYDSYKYRIETSQGNIIDKADPYAFLSEYRPQTASRVFDINDYTWHDKRWMRYRTKNFNKLLNIYEVHLGSWKIKKDFSDGKDVAYYSYEEMVDTLIPYVKEHGYSHIELMPLSEYPYDGSWGYQTTGYFSATSRYGNPKQLMHFIDECHKQKIGVILDFVPAHFVKDAHGLHLFDGGCVYEYPQLENRYTKWDSCYFDFGREEVRSFLMSAVQFWITYFHVDGIRFDAISNLIYWDGNKDRGVNQGAIDFMKRMNYHIHEKNPNVMMIAEDSSDYPKVTHSIEDGGLGFDYKWDLGWMNDTLKYFKEDPIYRQNIDVHRKLTFSMMYYYSEKFILPFSHDEVVHGKGTILDKMWGNNDQKFAQYKALHLYMMTRPGKKLHFMGNELAEYKEWNERDSLGWNLLEYRQHADFFKYYHELNHMIASHPAFYYHDYDPKGFEWMIVDDNMQSVFAYTRTYKSKVYVCVMNFVSNSHIGYEIPVPKKGIYKEIINTDSYYYSGSNQVNQEPLTTIAQEKNGQKHIIKVNIAPFSAMIFELEPLKRKTK